MNKPWAHLPNAIYIDFVLESVKYNPDDWDLAWVAGWDPVMYQARDRAWGLACNLVSCTVWDLARTAVRNASKGAAMDAAMEVILVLIAYDDCAYMLDMDYEELRTYAIISENPAAILLLPAVKALQLIKEKKNTKCHV
jgi:hypothetical protein